MGPSRLAWMHLILWPFTISSSFSPIFTSCLKRPCTVSYLAALLPKTFEQRQNWQERGKTGKRERESFLQQPGAGLNCTARPLLPPKLEVTHEEQRSCRGIKIRTKKTSTQLCNPTAGSRVPRLQCYQARFQGFAGFQGSRVLNHHGSGAPSFQGSKFQGSRLVRVLV